MFSLDDHLPHGNAIPLASGPSGDSEHAWQLRFTPAAHGGAERLWFNARIRNHGGRAGAPLELVLDEVDQLLGGGGKQPLRPVWRADGGDWQRLPAGSEQRSADGRLAVSWVLPAPAVEGQLAVCLPYGEPELRESLALGGDYWHEARIGTSCGDRPLLRVSNGVGAVGDTRPGILCLARTHSGETPGSWALDGFLRRCAELRTSDVQLWVIPFVDRDGVEQGDYGKDHWPRDFNRAWTASQSYRHEVAQIQNDARRWRQRCRPLLALDWHAPGMRDCAPHCHDEAETPDPLTDAMAAAFEVGPERFRRCAGYMNRLFEELGMSGNAPNAAQYFRSQYQIRGITMEVPYMLVGERPLLAEDFRAIGAGVADVCLDWVRQQALAQNAETPVAAAAAG